MSKSLRKYAKLAPEEIASAAQAAHQRRRQPIKKWAIGVVLLVALAGALGMWWLLFIRSPVSNGLTVLRNAYRKQRPIEARLSALDYAPIVNTRGDQQGEVDQNARAIAERTLIDAALHQPSSASHHSLGLLYLTDRKFDEAITQFEEGLKAAAGHAGLHNDLGAALMESGRMEHGDEPYGKSLIQFARALEHFNRALDAENLRLDALFNRALCYENMFLTYQAAAAWREYLERDSTTRWAAEAFQHLRAIEERQATDVTGERLVNDFVVSYEKNDVGRAWEVLRNSRAGIGDVIGSLVVENLLNDFFDLRSRKGYKEANERLRMLVYAGKIEARRVDDRGVSSLARCYQTANPTRLSFLAEARRLLKLGSKQYNQSRLEEALNNLKRAQELFQSAGDAYSARLAEYRTGHCLLMQSKSRQSLVVFQKVARDCESAQYHWLLALSAFSIANVQIGLTEYSQAIAATQQALAIWREIDDTAGMMKALQQLAQEYLWLNNHRKALNLHAQVLTMQKGCFPEPLLVWKSYFYMGSPLSALGLNAAAIEYQKEALRRAEEVGLLQPICRSHIHLGLMFGARGDHEAAINEMRIAVERGGYLPSNKSRLETQAYASLQLGRLYRQACDYPAAIVSFEQAIAQYAELNFKAFEYVAWKGKVLSCMSQGNCAGIDQDLETALQLFETHRAKIVEESNRDSFFDTEQDLYDAAIDFAYTAKQDPRAAIEYSERSRARSLLDLTHAAVQASEDNDVRPTTAYEPLATKAILDRLPERTQVVQYAATKDRLLIWLVSRAGIIGLHRTVSLAQLEENVAGFINAISRSGGAEQTSLTEASDLYDLLIEPVESLFDTNSQICIIPDKILYRLPFSALRSRRTERYLVEDRTIVIAPSLNMFILCSEAALARKESRSEQLLCVAKSRFDYLRFPRLLPLPSARREVENLARYYPGSYRLLDEAATKQRIMERLATAGVFHVASHAVVDERSPLRSKILLYDGKSGDQDSGVLQASEIYRLKLPMMRLVVLSACQTGVEDYHNGEGLIGLSRAFLAATVPLVVGSLWQVDSEATADLMIAFHRHRTSGQVPTAEALRRAQIDMLKGSAGLYRLPYYWAAFVTIGGYAQF